MTVAPPQALSLTMCVAHHPASDRAGSLRSRLYKHYRRDPRRNLGDGGIGIEVEYRSAPVTPGVVPIPVDFGRSQATAIVALLDEDLAGDPDLTAYVNRLAGEAKALFPNASFLPISLDAAGRRLSRAGAVGGWQELDATAWPDDEFARRLFTGVDYNLCQLLTAHLAAGGAVLPDRPDLRRAYTKKAQVLLSHSKHDDYGVPIAAVLKAELERIGAEPFFDAVSITPGTPWEDALNQAASSHALLVILTDSFSSRTWCRKEVLSAKRAGVPIVVANCLEDAEDRGFPYIGNVPNVRMSPDTRTRHPQVIGRLFDEVLRSLVWRCHTMGLTAPGLMFLPRAPELVSLAYLERELDGTSRPLTVVYPGVPLGEEEAELFATVAPHVKLSPFVNWAAGLAP